MNIEEMMAAGDSVFLDETKKDDFRRKLREYRDRIGRRQNFEESYASAQTLEFLLRIGIVGPSNIAKIARQTASELAESDGEPPFVIQALARGDMKQLLDGEWKRPEQAARLERLLGYVSNSLEVLRAYNDGDALLLKHGTGFGNREAVS